MSDLPTQEEALYALESPAFDATEQWCIDLLLPIFEAYAKGELVKLADADLAAAAAWLASTEGAFASREGKVDGVLAQAFGKGGSR